MWGLKRFTTEYNIRLSVQLKMKKNDMNSEIMSNMT